VERSGNGDVFSRFRTRVVFDKLALALSPDDGRATSGAVAGDCPEVLSTTTMLVEEADLPRDEADDGPSRAGTDALSYTTRLVVEADVPCEEGGDGPSKAGPDALAIVPRDEADDGPSIAGTDALPTTMALVVEADVPRDEADDGTARAGAAALVMISGPRESRDFNVTEGDELEAEDFSQCFLCLI
jgi:hypothetical protein